MASLTPIKSSFEDDYYMEEKPPNPEEHFELRTLSGLSPPPRPDNEISLKNTWYGITIREKLTKKAIAMGRIIGDGAIFLTIVDICTLPQHQKRGLASLILNALLKYCDKNASNAYLTLLADPPGIKLYKRLGFEENDSELPMVRSKFVSSEKRMQAAVLLKNWRKNESSSTTVTQ